MESDFTKWCLWSRNQKDQPQGVISHHSALSLHGFADYDPKSVHLTVPARFRKEIPDGLIIHKASLPLSAIESHGSFMVTRLGQTLFDMRKELEEKGEWDVIFKKVLDKGRLSHEGMKTLGFASKSIGFSYNTPELDIPTRQTITEEFKQNTEQAETQAGRTRAFDSVSEGVWKMMYDRADMGRRRSRAGFTLVELLVVIAIISILSALLLPMLGKAREQAYSIKCTSQLTQMGSAVMQYADDYRGYLPCSRARGTGVIHNYGTFMFQLSTYLGQQEGKDYPERHRLFQCPSDPELYYEMGFNFSYGANHLVYFYSSETCPTVAPYRYSTINNPSALQGIVDTESAIIIGGCGTTAWYYGDDYSGARHSNDTVNVQYLDGHVGKRTSPFMPAKDEPEAWTRTGVRNN
jgi:prepilin-type N-terminal cleavage/methylation domain-containing protein/prepilin-type processing-associated H-X9-DG protein